MDTNEANRDNNHLVQVNVFDCEPTMKNRMKTIHDLFEEAKLRTVWWALCIFGVTYFLSHTSKSMWMNLPVSVLLVCILRILFNEVEFCKKDRISNPQTYLSHLEGKQLSKQLSANHARNSTTPTPPKWKTKIDSPIVEAAICEFVDKLLNDFVIDLWLSVITPDREAAQHIRSIILDALGEVAARAKQLNLVDLLTKDVIDLIGNHLDLFRRNQAVIGVDVMKTLTSEKRDERLKHHLMVSKELHPALISADSEYKFLQRLMDGVLTTVLKPREAHCPVVLSIAREIVTCLVMQPVMSLANPGFTNEWIVTVLLAIHKEVSTGFGNILANNGPTLASKTGKNSSSKSNTSFDRASEISLAKLKHPETSSYQRKPKPADWARMLEVASKRRTEVLMPENLENMWAKGRNYKKKEKKYVEAGAGRLAKVASLDSSFPERSLRKARSMNKSEKNGEKGRILPSLSLQESIFDVLISDGKTSRTKLNPDSNTESLLGGGQVVSELDDAKLDGAPYKGQLRRSLSGSDLKVHSNKAGTSVISDFYSPKFGRRCEGLPGKGGLDMIIRKESQQIPKLRCRVIGAYYENLGSKSFAVYSIAVMAGENRYWFVKRRYSNFERLHRHLKEIPNYTIHLPPKRIFSSSTEDAFVHQRCIQLDKYLRDLLSIANVAEQHEVWDFLSASSQNYSFPKSSSAMKTLAVTVDDAADDIVRHFRGVSDGLTDSVHCPKLFCIAAEEEKSMSRQTSTDSAINFSDEGSEKDLSYTQIDDSQPNGWHSDNELNSRCFPPRIIKQGKRHKKNNMEENKRSRQSRPPANLTIGSVLEDPIGIPPEWTPSKLTVPLLNLVDNVLQLKRRGWLRRQVFWMSLQMLQLVMEDAIDDWLLGQINWLRKHDVIAQGIQWIQDILWPGGKFFLKIEIPQVPNDDDERKPFPLMNQYGGAKFSEQGSFEQQLEAARRASDLKKLLFEGVPTALVGLIGAKQYKHCARDIFYFTQSTVCVKQLAYAILELILVSLFPELRKTILDVHEKKHLQQLVQ